MINNANIPFNITLLNLTDEKLVGLKPVTKLDTFIGATKNFCEEGLFSVSIFGKVGDERRSRRFSYIDIKIGIFHPVIHRALIKLKKMYGDIISGKQNAVWSDEESDFVKTDALTGQTGFEFFRKHWKKIKFKSTESDTRDQTILLIEKFKDKAILSKIVVMPAGLRDFEIESDGRQSENEINDLYRKLLSLANTVNKEAVLNNPELLDVVSQSLQTTYIQIYDLIENTIQGKKKLMMSKWASRRVFNATRNVLTAVTVNSKDLDSKGNIDFNSTVIGLYQFMKASLPVSRFNLRNGFLTKVFMGPNAPAFLVNKKTFKKETVTVNPRYIDSWISDEGLEKVITSFQDASIRHKPVEIEGRYIGLMYKGPDGTFKPIQDIDELPPTRSKSDVYPMTFCELLFMAVYKTSNDYPLLFTRYPITGIGSIYPSKVFLKTTVVTEERSELDDNWQPMDDKHKAYHFPVAGAGFNDSLSPASAHLQLLTAD